MQIILLNKRPCPWDSNFGCNHCKILIEGHDETLIDGASRTMTNLNNMHGGSRKKYFSFFFFLLHILVRWTCDAHIIFGMIKFYIVY